MANAGAFFELKEGLERLFARPVGLLTDRTIRNPCFRQRLAAERQRLPPRGLDAGWRAPYTS